MRMKMFALVGLLALVMAPRAWATEAAACCDKPGMMACCTDHNCAMPCCREHSVQTDATAIDVLFAMDRNAVFTSPEAVFSQNESAAPTVQTAVVRFDRATWVGDFVLLGKYVIEHDTDRMARGEPCTHIYAANDRRLPVVSFHCRHLEGARADRDTVVVYSRPDGTRKFVSFEFAGKSAGHGVPAER